MMKYFYLTFLPFFLSTVSQAVIDFDQSFPGIITAYQPQLRTDLFNQEVSAIEAYRREDGTLFQFTYSLYPEAVFEEAATPDLPSNAKKCIEFIKTSLTAQDVPPLSPDKEDLLDLFTTHMAVKTSSHFLDDSVKEMIKKAL